MPSGRGDSMGAGSPSRVASSNSQGPRSNGRRVWPPVSTETVKVPVRVARSSLTSMWYSAAVKSASMGARCSRWRWAASRNVRYSERVSMMWRASPSSTMWRSSIGTCSSRCGGVALPVVRVAAGPVSGEPTAATSRAGSRARVSRLKHARLRIVLPLLGRRRGLDGIIGRGRGRLFRQHRRWGGAADGACGTVPPYAWPGHKEAPESP